MAVADDISNGGGAEIGGRESYVSAARINDHKAVGAGDIGDGQGVAIGAEVIGQRIERDWNIVGRRTGVGHRRGRQAVVEAVICGDNPIGGDKDELAVRPPLRIAGAVITVRQHLADDIMAGRDAKD